MAKRRLSSWIDSYMKYVRDSSESPEPFHYWAAVGTVSGALQRKVHLRWGHSKIYPNQYILLIGPSGTSRKGEPIVILRDLFQAIGLPMIGEDNTRESVIRNMRNAVTNFKDEDTGNIIFQCAATTFAEELSVFTGYQNREWLATLTNWWDSRDEWKRDTKHQGTDDLLGVCFNMVSSTAPDWLPHIFPREAVGGGLTSRIIMVVQEASQKIFEEPPLPDEKLKADLLFDLESIASLTGEMRFSIKAMNMYKTWYRKERQLALAGKHPVTHPMLQGYLGRKATHARKVSMALSAARRNTLVVESGDLAEAITQLDALEDKMPIAFRGLGKGRFSEETEIIEAHLAKRGTAKRSDIMRMMHSSLDAQSLDMVLNSLSIAKVISTKRVPGTDDVTITYTGKGKKGD